MGDTDFRVEVIGHATLRVQSGGKMLLTDPWLVGPIGCNSAFHFPPLVHRPEEIAAATDAIYISHVHVDHLHEPTLAYFPKHIPIYIGNYRRKEFRDRLRGLGFPVIEVPFQEMVPVAGTPFRIAIVEHDYAETAAYDSAIVIAAPEFTLFENNDCFLRREKYHWVRTHYAIDYAFLGYSPASFFPICFEMDADEKARLLAEAAERRYGDFLDAAAILAPRLAIPFASGARFLVARALWKNASFNSAAEALRRWRARGGAGAVMGPGDRILADGSIRRVTPVLDRDAELAAIADFAARMQDWIDGWQSREPEVGADLIDRFRDYILTRWRETRDKLPGVRRYVIAYVLLGAEERRFYFDFSQPEAEIFHWGEPPRYDMRYTYPSTGLQRVLDAEIDWDQLHFTTDVSVHQITYAKDFYTLLRSDVLDLG
jgi:L-ascorbate metabolism protein UlaG (beta-lactamase superfamily)